MSDRPTSVYRITCTVSGKSYIGICSCKVRRRWRRHVCRALSNKSRNGNCPALHGAIRKYGEVAFVIETLYEAVSWREAIAVERGLIAEYGTMVPRGYNLTAGGEGVLGCKFSAAERQRRSEALKGKPLSAEHRRKIGENQKGRILSQEHRDAIRKRALEWHKNPQNAAVFAERARSPERIALSIQNVKKANASNVGRSPNAETRAKMSAWQIGKKHSDETKAKIGARARERSALRGDP